MNRFLERLEEEILVLDGAMGTELHNKGLEVGECPEKLNLDQPEIVQSVHQSYVEAGSDIIQTNTFGGTRIKLNEYDLGNQVKEINTQAVKLAQGAAKEDTLVAASMGPTGKLIEPMGDFPFQAAYTAFAEQAQILEAAGVDLINIETMTDLQEARAALIAVKETTDLPVICHLTYEDSLKTMTGTDPVTAIEVLDAIGADVIGANCSMGPEGLLEVIQKMNQDTSARLSVEPNAGLPELDENNETIFPMQAQEMVSYAPQFIAAGINVIGGCCGSTPEYIRQLQDKVKGLKPQPKEKDSTTVLASRSQRVTISDQHPTRMIGERINPSGRDKFSEQLKNGSLELVSTEASKQAQAGADILDVNMGVPEVDQAQLMKQAVTTVQNATDLPITIDTTNQEALEAGLQNVVGKPLINSVTGEDSSLNKVLPLAKKYGAAVLGLTLDEDGIPDTAQQRLEVAKKIVATAEDYGISKENILIDTLTLAASAEQEKVLETIKAIRLIKEELGLATVLGVSNISYGLPERHQVNTSFLAMAIEAGLNAPIMDPTDENMKSALLASDFLVNRDPAGSRYLDEFAGQEDNSKPEETTTAQEDESQDPLDKIHATVLNGDQENILNHIELALENYPALDIINEGLIPGIKEVGDKYDEGTYFLPQLMMAAEVMKKAFSKLRPILEEQQSQESAGKIIMATVKGDVHDIGKNIVKVMLENNGFAIVDLGKDVSNDQIISSALDENADIICLSALMTTTMPRMKEITQKLKEVGPDIKVMVGGAVVTEEYANNIGAHYSDNAVQAVKKAQKLV
ncbi:homocysteine S-methyltransferase family protein [Halanaerobacter jeridensis]|uniref:Methionine synthase n=1 Tax=Halanaerobacter jeridensis TaxID=706427 RepID=A0A939BP76_9FIRM|nr:homocysteine S-methyltransferase family protein [Halanaerobacter jeridensis]MBM7556657.1 5-methyltetrahydrofolate--homocysteine methyltransferase [Halanaerobacter jeridensis]